MLVCLAGGASVFEADNFRMKAQLLPGVPARVNDRHNNVVSRGTYKTMLTTDSGRQALLSESSLIDTGNDSIGRPTTQLSAR